MTTQPQARRKALVIGAGVSGLTASIALATRRWDVRVQDRGDALDPRGAAIGIWPEAWRGLERLHVAPALTDAWEYRSATIRSVDGRVIGYLPLGRIRKQYGAPVRLVTRPALMAALVARAEHEGVQLVFRTPFRESDVLDEYDVVVGADGINSEVRKIIDPDIGPRSLGATAWRGSCDGLVGNWGEIWGRGIFAGVTPAGLTRTNWYVPVADSLSVRTSGDLQAALTDWPAEIRQAVEATDQDMLLRHPLQDLPALRSYTRDRFVLLGDAAHAMAPSLGQGACQAVLDALCFARCVSEDPDVPRALATYDALQRPGGNRLVKRSRQLLRLQLSPSMASVRDLLLRAARPISPR